MKIKTQCSVKHGAKECQLAVVRHEGEDVCWFHFENPHIKTFPRVKESKDRGEANGLESEYPGLVEDLKKAQNHACCICGKVFRSNQDLEIEHLWPVVLGGGNELENLGLAHAKCNNTKKGLPLWDPRIRERIAKIARHFVDGESKDRLSNKQELDVCRLYEEEEKTQPELGKMFGVSGGTIGRILKRRGVRIRTMKESKGGLMDEQEQEVCRLYVEEEMNTVELGRMFGVTQGCIYLILIRRGIKTRTISEAQGGITDEQELEVCRLYVEEEKSSRDLGRMFGVTKRPILNILKRRGVKRRTSGGEAQKGRPNMKNRALTDEQEQEVEYLYLEEEKSSRDLGRMFGVSQGCISLILKRRGIKMRTSKEAQQLRFKKQANGN